METLRPGQSIGHLRIERELARGGFAVVYLAEDTRLRRKVALKVLHSPMQKGTSEGEFGAFLDEARVIARLASPNVVTLFSLQETDDGSLILEMEYVPSGTLDDLLVKGGIDVERAEAILRDVLAGLAAAHEDGVLHRDVKPANVLIARGGTAKLSDFGLARVMGEESEIGEGPMGTPFYMAPEQLSGSPATEQSDLWSVGVVAYQVLAGTRPFPTPDAVSFFVTVQNDDPIPLPPHVPPRLRDLVMSCLEKDPARRPESCKDALARLDQVLARPIASRIRAPASQTFHGRDEELRQIDRVLETEENGTLLVAGPAGIGKSALLAEAARQARAGGALWVDARLSKIEGPLVTVVEAVRRVAPSAEGAITNAFGPDDSKLKTILQGGDLPALENSQQVLWTLQHLLSGVARTRHLVISVDDAQNASEEDLALLSDLARRFTDQPFTLIVATRPAAHAMAGFADAERLDLEGLDEEAMFPFLEDRLHASIPGRVVSRVHRRTDGNPLHALELMRHLESTGALDRREGALETTKQWEQETVPARLRDIVHARMVRLEDTDRALLEVAAVDGPVFDGRAVAAVQGMPVLDVLRRLQALSRSRALIEPARHGYRFANRPTQEVLYEDMAPELRIELHRALAEHLEERGDKVEAARLARHWERSGERKRAAPYLIQVAASAQSRQEWRRLVDFAGRAGLLEDPPLVDLHEHREVAISTASALIQGGRHEEGDALYERVEQAVSQAADESLAERVAVHRATACLVNGRRPEGDEARWEAAAQRLGETMEGANARAVIGRLAKLDGRLEVARAAFEEADRVYCALGKDWQHSTMQDQLGAVAMRENRLADARSSYRAAADLAEAMGNTNNAAVSRTNATLAGMLDGDVDGADHELHRAVRTFDLNGSTSTAAHVRIYLAEALYANGRSADALAEIETAVTALESTDNRRALTNAWRLQAELLALMDRAAEAKEAIARALEHSKAAGDRIQDIVAHAVEALIATASDAPDDAARALEDLEAANPDRSVPGDGAVLALTEAVLYGLPPASLEGVGYLARNDQEKLLLDAALRCVRGESCEAPLEALGAMKIGLRQATYRLLCAWLAAESAKRRGDEALLPSLTAAAREAATVMGHERALRSLGR